MKEYLSKIEQCEKWSTTARDYVKQDLGAASCTWKNN